MIYALVNELANTLRAVNLDGSGDTALAGPSAFYASSTPSGRVLFRTASGDADLYVIEADGTGLLPLANSGNNEFFAGLVP